MAALPPQYRVVCWTPVLTGCRPGELFAMQSGTEPPDYEEILPNRRWHRLCGGFREAGALLVLAIPESAPHIEDLVAAADGAVLVADAAPPTIPFSRVIARVSEPRINETIFTMPAGADEYAVLRVKSRNCPEE